MLETLKSQSPLFLAFGGATGFLGGYEIAHGNTRALVFALAFGAALAAVQIMARKFLA